MKLNITYTLTGQAPVTVACGPRAISAAERAYDFRVSAAASEGLAMEWLGYMAWSQAVNDARFLGPWTEFWGTLDDLDVTASRPDPTGPAPEPSPTPS